MKFLSRFSMLVVVVFLSFHLINSPVVAGQGLNLCTKTSQDVLISCNHGVQDNYWLAIGKCDNFPTQEVRNVCRQIALQDKRSGFDECRAQFAARQEICETLGGDAYNPIINPANFVDKIDNSYFPLTPGTKYIYEGKTEKGDEHVEVKVTNETKVILGVTCVVVRDTGTVDGELVEDTIDWYAQDKKGNVWYFGENALSYEGGLIVSLGGSWMAGVDGAKAGIVMKAHPKVGDLYRQEFALGVAEDMAEVLSLNESTIVPAGSFTNCLMTKDFSAIEPDAIEHKLYAPGIGNVQTVDVNSGNHLDLIKIIIE